MCKEDHEVDLEENQEERLEMEMKSVQVEDSVKELGGEKAVIEEDEKEENDKSMHKDDTNRVEDFVAFWKRHCEEKESACKHTRHRK